jgi:hypothetical protein
MAKGEAMTPVPEGIITTTDILQPVPEVIEEVTPVEVKEDELSD